MPALPPERPAMLGDVRSPAPPATAPARGHEPPDPHGRPLPDPTAVRLCRIPDSAPPYDQLSTDGQVSYGELSREEAPGNTGARGHPGDEDPGHRPEGLPSAPAVPPEWQSRFAQVLVETLAGSRPARQMAPWTTEHVRTRIERLGPRLASSQRPMVRRVVTFHPTSDVMEMTVVAGFGPRVRALAVRLERSGPCPAARGGPSAAPRWLCTAVEAA
jgi:Family of unknown function (DUF6459)